MTKYFFYPWILLIFNNLHCKNKQKAPALQGLKLEFGLYMPYMEEREKVASVRKDSMTEMLQKPNTQHQWKEMKSQQGDAASLWQEGREAAYCSLLAVKRV